MSTPPKEPKPEEARRAGASALESTFLGVAPTAPTAPTEQPAAAGSAIIAAPMISVSDRTRRGPAEPPLTPAVAPAVQAPARASGLQGGWQSAGIPRAPGPEQTVLHGTPGAWPMPPLATPATTAPATPAPPPTPQRAAPPRPEPQAQAGRAAAPNPLAAGGLQHTALASDYLRGARDVALGGAATAGERRPGAPAQPTEVGRQTAYSPVSTPAPPRAHWQEPPASALHTHGPLSNLNATAASSGHSPPPPTMGPPPTAELSTPMPIPLHAAPQPPVQVFYAEPDPGLSPRSMGTQASMGAQASMGTQASIAPPPRELGASFHGPMAPAIHDALPAPVAPTPAPAPLAAALMAPVASPVRHGVPQALAGTMLDRTPSIPGGALPQGMPPPPANPTLRFEQVPAPRSSLAQQGTSFGLNIPIEPQGATQWGRTAHEGKAAGRPSKGRQKTSQLRMAVLTFFALLSVLFAAFGPELRVWVDAQMANSGPRGTPITATADQTTLTNLPRPGTSANATGATESAAPVGAVAAAATGAPPSAAPASAATAAAPSAAGAVAEPAAAPAVEASPVAAPAEEEPPPPRSRRGRGRDAKASAEAAASATAESRLAADAGKHVLAGRHAEALPLYRALQRDYPQNTAYAAMTKVLEQKVAGSTPTGAQP